MCEKYLFVKNPVDCGVISHGRINYKTNSLKGKESENNACSLLRIVKHTRYCVFTITIPGALVIEFT